MTDTIGKIVVVAAIVAAAWYLFGRRACCAACAGKQKLPATAVESRPPKAQARGCSPFACGR